MFNKFFIHKFAEFGHSKFVFQCCYAQRAMLSCRLVNKRILRGRIRKVSSLFLFFKNIFSFFVFISPCLFPGLVPHPYGVVGGLTMGSSSGVRPALAGNQVVNK